MSHAARRVLTLLFVCAGCWLRPTSAHADRITAELLDGTQRSGMLASLSSTNLVLENEGNEVTIPISNLSNIVFDDRAQRRSRFGNSVFLLADGGRIGGSLVDGAPTQITARTALGEELVLAYEHLAGIRLTGPADAAKLFDEALANRLAGKDVLIALREDGPAALRGTLSELNPEDGEFVFSGKSRGFRTSKIYGVVFAAGAGAPKSGDVTVKLADGDAFTGVGPNISEDRLSIAASFGVDLEIPIDRVRSLSCRSDRVIYLSDLEPQTQSSRGILHDNWLIRTNRNVFNQPIVLGGRTYEHGLGVHARATLTYALDGNYETFAATVGIDDAVRPGGHANFVVIGDGKRLHETGPLTGNDAPRPVRVAVAGVDELTLEVEPAGDIDVGDWADWADARIILPQSQP